MKLPTPKTAFLGYVAFTLISSRFIPLLLPKVLCVKPIYCLLVIDWIFVNLALLLITFPYYEEWYLLGVKYTQAEFEKLRNPRPHVGEVIVKDGVSYILH